MYFLEMGTSEMLVNLSYSSLEEFYPACAIAMLLKVIKDPTLSQNHNEVVRVGHTGLCWVMFVYLLLTHFCFIFVPYFIYLLISFHNITLINFPPPPPPCPGHHLHLQVVRGEGSAISCPGRSLVTHGHQNLRCQLPGLPLPAAGNPDRHCEAAHP